MTRAKTDKSFDCIKFKREAQQKIYDKIKHLSPKQEVDYFKKRVENGPFAAWLKKVEKKKL